MRILGLGVQGEDPRFRHAGLGSSVKECGFRVLRGGGWGWRKIFISFRIYTFILCVLKYEINIKFKPRF